jgi:anthranilate phosphoribosyltransferase
MKDFIEKIRHNENLTVEEIKSIMHEIMTGIAHKEDVAQFLLALRDKGPTVEEITGAAQIMRDFVVPIKTQHANILDTCGTGGDKKNTFNISTLTALVAAGAGAIVAKHGNRSVSSRCGSADVLEALGVHLDMESKYIGECLNSVGIAFLYAQKLHPAMKNVAPVRKALEKETIFNVLGPLTNPANATHQMMGVYNRDLVAPLAHVLKNLGLKKSIVMHGSDGLDEITTTGKTYLCEFDGDQIETYDIDPEELGFKLASPRDLEAHSLEDNIKIFKNVLGGDRGPKRDIVLLNAAYALYISECAGSIQEGVLLAKDSIDSGKAARKLEELVAFTNRIDKVNKGEID